MVNLSDMEMDALREVGNVGVGNAATALSKLISKKVDITIPDTGFVPLGKFAEVAGGPETVVNCLYIKIIGEVEGESLMFFKEDSTKKFVDLIMGNEIGKTQAMGEMELSAFAEMSNIVVGAYLSSLANMLSFSVMPSPPKTAYDMLQSVIDVILARLSRSADEILYIKTHISIGDEKIEGSMIVMFNEDSLKKVLNKLKELYGVSV